MFKEKYILDLLSGHLTQKGYASIVGSIASMARHYSWQKILLYQTPLPRFGQMMISRNLPNSSLNGLL